MGLIDTKTVDTTPNVINKVEPNNNDLELIHTLLIIIVVIMCANCFYKLYKLHNNCKANDLDKIKKIKEENSRQRNDNLHRHV